MYKKPLQPKQCRFCGIIATEKRPVKSHICSVCRGLRKEFPKKVKCFICGRPFNITFEENSERGNTCVDCDRRITEKVQLTGYRTLPESRSKMKEFLLGLKS